MVYQNIFYLDAKVGMTLAKGTLSLTFFFNMKQATKQIRDQINELFGIQKGATGEIALFDSIQKDLVALSGIFPEAQKWSEAFEDILVCLVNSDKSKIKSDKLALQHLPLTPHKHFVAQPASTLSTREAISLRAVRAAIFISHFKNKTRISKILAATLRQMFEDQHHEIRFENSFSLDNLIEMQQRNTKPGTEIFKVISQLIMALRVGFSFEDVQEKIPVGLKKIEDEAKIDGPSEKTAGQKKKEHKPHPIHEDGDLLAYLLSDQKFANPRDFSGVSNHYSGLQPFEICAYFSGVLNEFRETRQEVLLGILLSFHLRVGPAHFNLVHFEFSPGRNVWIDLSTGSLCWNRLALVNGLDSIEIPSERDVFQIPLPSELVVELKLKASAKQAKKLGQIFFTPLFQLKKSMRKYAFTHSVSAHVPHLTRVAKTVGRLIFHICRDDVYAAALSLDFSLSTQSSFYYFVSQPTRINQICKEVYERIGYQPFLYREINKVSGANIGDSVSQLKSCLNSQLSLAIEVFNGLHAKSSLKILILTHNQISISIGVLTSVLLGLRRAEEYSICTHTLDLSNERVLITDKASSEYLTVRLMPLPRFLVEWLGFYFAWLSRLAFRLSTKAPQLSLEINSTLPSASIRLATAPTLFLIEQEKLVPIGSWHIEHKFAAWKLPVNVGRHVLDFELRKLTNSSLVNIFLSHANPGQEGLGLRSALPTVRALGELRTVLDQIVEGFDLPAAPKISKVSSHPLTGTKLHDAFRPKLWKVRYG